MKKLLEDNDLGFDLTRKGERMALRFIKLLTGINKLNNFHDKLSGYGVKFTQSCLDELMITVECSDKSMRNIPQDGAFIVVANMPHGALDGLLLLSTIGKKRPDTKIIGNFPITQIERLKDSIISVDPFTSKQKSNFASIRQAKQHLDQGHPLIIFPANRIASRSIGMSKFNETPWSEANLKFIISANKRIIPTHISGHSSLLFSALGLMNQNIQAMYTGRELLNKEGREYTIEIGQAMDLETTTKLKTIDSFRSFLRTNIALLNNRSKHLAKHSTQNDTKKSQAETNLLEGLTRQDITKQANADSLLLRHENYEFYSTTYKTVGTWVDSIFGQDDKSNDLYIVGIEKTTNQAFCMCEIRYGDKALAEKGIDGLYTHKYFEYSHKYFDTIRKSIELGKKYLTPQIKAEESKNDEIRISTLVWKSAIILLSKDERYRYLLGTTSINSRYSTIAKTIIAKYIETHATDKRLTKMAIARHGIGKISKNTLDKKNHFASTELSLTNKLIADINHQATTIPSTLSYLIDQKATIITLSTNHNKRDKMNALVLIDITKRP